MSLSVLVVEDEAPHALAFREELSRLGHEVVGLAKDGQEALDLREKLKPELVLMDIQMPKLDGIEAARRMNQSEPLPVVLVTAFANRDFLLRAREAGVYSYLLKPVERTLLGPAIEIAHKNFARVRHLAKEAQDLREALKERKLIARAKGLLMDRKQLTEEQAEAKMADECQRQGVSRAQLAEAMLAVKDMWVNT